MDDDSSFREGQGVQPGSATGTAQRGPLHGIRVLDLTHIAAGPLATSMLGDMGAEVVKVEPLHGGDPTRAYDRVFPGADSSYFLGINRSKQSVAVDLKTPGGLRVVSDLLARSQVVVENYRPGALRRLGLDYDSVARARPDIVYCSISAFGTAGPHAQRPGMDILVQGMSGLMSITGEPGRPPVKIGAPVADFMGAYLAAYGISLALLAKERFGVGQLVTVSLLDGQIAALSNYLTGFHATGRPDGPSGGAHPQIVPYQVFEASDGHLIVACLTERFWRNLCSALGREDLARDPRYGTNDARARHRGALIPVLAEAFERRTRAEWVRILGAADVPCGPVNGLAEAFADQQVRHNGMVVEVDHPEAGRISVPGVPVKLHATPGQVRSPPPTLGQHTVDVLTELGYSPAAIRKLREEGAI